MMVSDEEKRWLVVGIAMNKVVAPVLRDFIEKGMDTHYKNLDIYCSGLPTPCTLTTLTYHQVLTDPHKYFKDLNFKNVNNNLQLYGKKKKDLHKYNYNINTSVDLAKLFLQDQYLSEFSTFDDSVDMSAILCLLGFKNPSPIFHSPKPSISVQDSAIDVRKNVRNKWAHCNATYWTEIIFSDCFSKLKTLVESLSLPGGKEKSTLDQLSDWQTKGCQLCMGHAVDKDLLSLVQREVKNIMDDLARHDARLHAVETKLQEDVKTRREDIGKILEKLMSINEILDKELLPRLEEVEQGLATANIKVEELGKGLHKTDDKVEQVQDVLAKTGDRVEQLEQMMKDVKPALSPWPAEPFDLKSCRRKLAQHYRRTATVNTSVWSKTSPVDIHQIYTRLSWVKEEQTPAGSSRSELNHYTDVFTRDKYGVVPKRILVQGQTGIGKSTFVKKLAVDWAELDDATTGDKQKDILKNFEVLVAVNLKEVSKCERLKDVISRSSIFPREDKHFTDSLLKYITNNQEKVLLVFDGYDEYRYRSNSEIYEIFRGNALRNCCVLITSRISEADELRAFKDLHAEITGFSERDRMAFMIRMLGGSAEATELWGHLLRLNLEDLAKVPLLILFFCTLWKKGKLKSFPETKTKLYFAITQYVLDHDQGKDSPIRYGEVYEFREILSEFGKVALECLLKEDYVFKYGQLSSAIRFEKRLITGFLQVTQHTENLRPADMVSFAHKSIQEFLAAWYIAYRCVPEGNLGGIDQKAGTLEDCEAWKNVLQFVSGLSDEGAVKVFQHLKSVRISDSTLDVSKTTPGVGVKNEPDVQLYDVTQRHERFSDLVYDSFQEVQSKVELVSHWFDCTAGIVLVTPERPFPEFIQKMTRSSKVTFSGGFYFYNRGLSFLANRVNVSIIYELLKSLLTSCSTDNNREPVCGSLDWRFFDNFQDSRMRNL